MVIYVQGSWLSSFVFKVTSTRFELKDDISTLDIRICPESLVERVRTIMLPLTFQPFHIGGSKGQVDQLLAVSALAGSLDISPWSKWISLKNGQVP